MWRLVFDELIGGPFDQQPYTTIRQVVASSSSPKKENTSAAMFSINIDPNSSTVSINSSGENKFAASDSREAGKLKTLRREKKLLLKQLHELAS